jgi:hypothetical protein
MSMMIMMMIIVVITMKMPMVWDVPNRIFKKCILRIIRHTRLRYMTPYAYVNVYMVIWYAHP